MCVKVSFRSVAYVCVGFPHICVCRISRASGVPLFTYFHQIDTSHYLPDYLHLIIQACHYLPIPALITGSVSIQSNSNYNIYALQSCLTRTICAAVFNAPYLHAHYMRASATVFNALEFCSLVSGDNCGECNDWRPGGNYQQQNLIRIKAHPQFTPVCQWSGWSSWSDSNQMIATHWSPFDCLIDTSTSSTNGALWVWAIILAHMVPVDSGNL